MSRERRGTGSGGAARTTGGGLLPKRGLARLAGGLLCLAALGGCFSSSKGGGGPTDGGGEDSTFPSSSSSSSGGSGSGSSSGSRDGSSSGTGTSSGSSGGSGSGSGGGTDASNSCPSAQTQFGITAQGDVNTNFQSGVGARTATDLYIFSGYVGPDPTADAGAPTINATYVQAFDAQTAVSKGPAQLLFVQPNLINSDFGGYVSALYSTAVSPTGQIALVYRANHNGNTDIGLYAAFLDSAVDAGTGSDGGVAGLQVKNIVLLETVWMTGQPYVIWSDASQAFVISWFYHPGPGDPGPGAAVAVAKFLVGGQAAGGSTNPVPTNDPNGYVYNPTLGYALVPSSVSGSVGESGNLLGVAYLDTPGNNPGITVLDSVGNQVGSSFELVPDAGGGWSAVGGTSNGFVYVYDKASPSSVAEIFLPTSGDAGVIGSGDAGAFPTFSFTGGARANAARAIADGTGGVGGVGLALLYPTQVSFAYVNADGVGHQGPETVFAHTYNDGDEVSMTNVAGSFVVSLYDSSTRSTKVAASGCP
ncbi:MAG: hypothetical protein ACLP1X_01690 [Polyangiaceae bacterium]|jgi:hypothetical protein